MDKIGGICPKCKIFFYCEKCPICKTKLNLARVGVLIDKRKIYGHMVED